MRTVVARWVTLVAVCAGTLGHAWSAPATTITVPVTLARSLHVLSGRHESVSLAYPATHVAFTWVGPRRSKIRYRTVSDGAASAWAKVPQVHGSRSAERAGTHFSAVLAVGRADRVEWAGVGRLAAEIERVTLDYLNTLDGRRREVRIPSVASAAAGPRIVTRAEWGADESLKRTSGSCTRQFFRLQQLFVHHTAGKNYDSNPRATMRAIYWYHVVRQGWCDIGYNFVVGPDGTVFEGRWARRYKPWETHTGETSSGRIVAGAHTESYNSGSAGISLMGNYSQISLPPAARRSLVELLAWETDRHDLSPRGIHVYRNPDTGTTRRLPYIAGHRDAGTTACPGSNVYRDLREIRDEVARARGTGRATTEITLTPASRSFAYGTPAMLEGTLTDASGAGLPARPVDSYVKQAGKRWRVGPGTLTDESGDFQLQVDAARNAKVIALYEGDARTWGAQSDAVSVRVAPVVTIEAEGGTAGAAGISHHPSGTESVTLIGAVEPPHVRRSVEVRVSRMEDGEYVLVSRSGAPLDDQSRYRYVFTVDDAGGTYQAVAVFAADEDHARARSNTITFVVDP